ncbi:FMN-binding glutamate synthase family protein [Cocleimonas flava]|nr:MULTISPECIES: FMN-binding glutamate synthase family protein [Cocleimonas]MEB8431446.1 FMN-binding glutamate synthase family protein [Cocleimonas sp. KMM 6892]MEC4713782.1 FMN-binding glutamate synthase family protein [Cocleimonas sp. KMM 6895]MEC4743113.1 FMN-binding glutamate synthase family protein [Cocleimonas sp. KMM 6896]
MEYIRPEIQQYFIEDETNGKPISREFRALVYQRAKGVRDTRAFGTVFDVYEQGYEWINHSLQPHVIEDKNPRVIFGAKNCSKPYSASPLNISAMSYGALSKNAIMALNKGAKIDNFAHNTGEGGVSPYHLKHGGDLIWQIGTGYFGCRNNATGGFDEEKFIKMASREEIKMIEIKLSQGAKPGHGGILPAAKLTQEIVDIRGVEMGKDVVSPPAHTAFSSPEGLLEFVANLREKSGGKPVGFKLCIGHKAEFLAICKAMKKTGLTPDFVTVDGSEGGTGAAPIEMANSVGMPLRDALSFVHNALIGTGVRDDIRIIAAGKVISAFHMMRVLALGADTINSARGMMFALGCIQSRHCNTDKCPTGIATQEPVRYEALDVTDKGQRVANYHHSMVKHIVELLEVAGINHTEEVMPWHINRRASATEIKSYYDIYETLEEGCLLSKKTIPEKWQRSWDMANADTWELNPVVKKKPALAD